MTTNTDNIDSIDRKSKNLLLFYRHIAGYEEMQTRAHNDVEKYIGNPLNSYLLIKKLTSDWKEVQNLLSPSPDNTFANLTDNYEQPLKWPSEEDLSGAAIGKKHCQFSSFKWSCYVKWLNNSPKKVKNSR